MISRKAGGFAWSLSRGGGAEERRGVCLGGGRGARVPPPRMRLGGAPGPGGGSDPAPQEISCGRGGGGGGDHRFDTPEGRTHNCYRIEINTGRLAGIRPLF